MRDAAQTEFECVYRSAYPSVLRTTYLILQDRGRGRCQSPLRLSDLSLPDPDAILLPTSEVRPRQSRPVSF